MQGTKGITLIALVITIVIIIILSTIAINFTFGENGLITRAQQAAEMSEVSRILEQLEMAKGSAYIDGAGEIEPDHYFDILEEEGIINDKETDVVDNGDGTYDVTTEGDRVFEVTLEPNGDLDIEYIGKNNEPRISEIKVTDKTENSISVEVVTKNIENAEYTYSYKKTEEGEETWQEAGKSNTNTFTFSSLENNTSYDIKVTVKLDDGTTIEKTITVQLGTGVVGIPDGTITFGQATWQIDGTANITISTTESGYTLQYQIGSTVGQWTTITSGQSITGLKHGDTVYARLADETETNTSEIQETTIEDKGVPEVNVISTGNTSNSISVSVSATDKESGMSDSVTYTYSIKQSGNPDYSVEATDISQNTYTFSNLQSGISYDIKVEVKADKAGNVGIGYLAGQTTTDIPGGEDLLEDGTITVGDTVWADGKASIDISTDSDYQIEYQINGITEESWTNIGNSGTVSELKYGDTVNIRLTDGTNHGDFVTVTIGDEIEPTVDVTLGTSTSNSIRVNVVANDSESGMSGNPTYTYYIKENTEPDSSYAIPEGATDIAANTYTFANLKQNTSYDIKVEVKADLAGNMGTGTLLNQKTKTIPSGEGETEQGITFGEPIWSEGKASITVSTEETEYSIEYKLSEPDVETGWTTIENNGMISELSHGSTVYARLTDGNNHGDYAQTTIKDEINPVVDVKLDGLITSSNIKVNVTANDNESEMSANPTYTYYIKQSGEEDTEYVAKANNITENTYTFTGLQQGTSYDVKVEVTGDNAGNTGTGYLAGQTTATIPDGSGEDVEEGAITFGEVSWSSNKASISVSTNTSYQIEYQVGAITEGSWIGISSGGTISNLEYGDMVYARLTDGVNHGEYASASIDEKIAPQAANIELSATNTMTTGSVTATVTLSDNESGVDVTGSKWIYNTNAGNIGTDEGSYTNNFTTNPEELTLSANTAGTYYLHVLTKDIAGNKVETISEAITVAEPTIENVLIAGDWVRYEDGTGVSRDCVVLYDSTSEYGVEIITMETVEDVELGNGTGSIQTDNTTYFNTAMNSYNNVITTLNNATSKYLNTAYADASRSVGSDPSNPTSDNPGYFTSNYSYMSSYNGQFKNEDTHYETDLDQVHALGIHAIDEIYWLASRQVYSDSISSIFRVYFRGTGNIAFEVRDLCSVYSFGRTVSHSYTYGLRPVFHLKSDVIVTGGSGTEEDPYILYAELPDMGDAKPNPGEDGPEYGTNTPVQDDQGNIVVIPGGFHLDEDSGTSVEEGIVIEDSNGNQFVWIPTGTYNVTEAVDNDGTKDGKLTNNLSRRTFTLSGATEVNGDTAISTYFYGEGDSRSVAYSQIGAFKDSVSRNGGFYIGRYEQGTGNVIRAGVAPDTNMTRDTAKSQIEAMYSGNSYVVSELISSYAWDTALNFICQTNSAGYTLATTTDDSYGNIGTESIKNTGVDANDNYSNIHDLLGNCIEWTTEYSDDIDGRTMRM